MMENDIHRNKEAHKLLIIGNGFDRAHSLPTSYYDFKKYMSNFIRGQRGERESDELIEINEVPKEGTPKIYTHKGVFEDLKSESEASYWLIDEVAKKKRDLMWRDFENYLGQMNIEKLLAKWEADRFGVHFLRETIDDIKGFFFDWINTIEINCAKQKTYLSIFNGEPVIVLSFNYTETLETVYGVSSEDICYIHGKRETNETLRKDKMMLPIGQDNTILEVGFGKKYIRNNKEVKKKVMLMTLYKDTEDIIRRHKDFFDRVGASKIKEIYTLGFSFSNVDIPYINEICKEINKKEGTKDITWFITPYGSSKLKKEREEVHMRMCLWKSGFRGKVKGFEG